MTTFGNIFDWFCAIGCTIVALAWAAYGFGWIASPPTRNTADMMVISFYFQAAYFFTQIANRNAR